ncbi:MAG: peptide chain release factor N(5)-glutamine methyltransferase [Victivallaceae bacterium]|nr:peptide chain release factor N(5)-glutamine methyltransferase [Victivallaceae bacterium]
MKKSQKRNLLISSAKPVPESGCRDIGVACVQALENTAARLAAAGIEANRTESELILAELTGGLRSELFLRRNDRLSTALTTALEKIVRRRENREPLQYILGHAYFMNLKLAVTPAVLIPRPETELLAEYLIKTAPPAATVLDLGTGSGAIALALAFERRDLRITGVDISTSALRVAERNRDKYRLDNVEFLHSDLFGRLGGRRFDRIAANLPYVTESEYLTLMPEVRDFEPKLALTAAGDGLKLILSCAAEAPEHLNSGGGIIFEIGLNQEQRLREALAAGGKFADITVVQDYSRRNRFVRAELGT